MDHYLFWQVCQLHTHSCMRWIITYFDGPLPILTSLSALCHILTNLSALCHNRYGMDHYIFQRWIIKCLHGPLHYWQTCQLHVKFYMMECYTFEWTITVCFIPYFDKLVSFMPQPVQDGSLHVSGKDHYMRVWTISLLTNLSASCHKPPVSVMGFDNLGNCHQSFKITH